MQQSIKYIADTKYGHEPLYIKMKYEGAYRLFRDKNVFNWNE